MAITLTNLNNKKGNNNFQFSDLHLDLQESKSSLNNRNSDIVNGNDIIIDIDDAAIKNSLRNIFSQRRYLNPNFGINLRKHIGKALTEMGAISLGEEIKRGIYLFEPRILVNHIYIAPDFDLPGYRGILDLSLPNFARRAIINLSLNNIGDVSFTS